MAGLPIGLAIGLDALGQLHERPLPHRDKDRQPHPADPREGLRRRRRHAQFGPGLLIRLRRHRDVVEAVILALVGKPLLGPGLFQDLERLGEALAALAVIETVILVGAHDAAAADAVDQPAVADLIDRRGLLGEAQRVRQRQHLHRDADLDRAGARGDRARHHHRRRHHRALGRAVQFGQPDRVEPDPFGLLDLGQCLFERGASPPPATGGNSMKLPNSISDILPR